MNKPAITAVVGIPAGFLAGVLYSHWHVLNQRSRQTVTEHGISIDSLGDRLNALADRQRVQENIMNRLKAKPGTVPEGDDELPL